jgi:hypothetical protein
VTCYGRTPRGGCRHETDSTASSPPPLPCSRWRPPPPAQTPAEPAFEGGRGHRGPGRRARHRPRRQRHPRAAARATSRSARPAARSKSCRRLSTRTGASSTPPVRRTAGDRPRRGARRAPLPAALPRPELQGGGGARPAGAAAARRPRRRAWLRGGLQPGDLVAVASYGTSLALHQDFTADRAALERAVDRAVRNAAPPDRWPSRTPAESDLPALTATLPEGILCATRARPRSRAGDAGPRRRADRRPQEPGALHHRLRPHRRISEGSTCPTSTSIGRWSEAQRGQRRRLRVDLVAPGVEHSLESSISRLAADTGGRPFFDLLDFSPSARAHRRDDQRLLPGGLPQPPSGRRVGLRADRGVELVNPEFRVTARKGYRYGEAR